MDTEIAAVTPWRASVSRDAASLARFTVTNWRRLAETARADWRRACVLPASGPPSPPTPRLAPRA
ncbi:MAG TPA: hypothetical protein VGJ29_13385 [Vicinamibacterales bacterium]|jgi:hypothetical protein